MKKILFIIFVSLLSACGFIPMHTGKTVDIYVAPISGINGIELRNALWAEFGNQYSSDATYKLTVNLNTPKTQYKALEQTGNATWQEVSLTAKYTLSVNDKEIATGSERASESYPFVSYLVASNASYNNAIKNIIRTLSEQISSRVIAETYKYEHQNTDK
ncbi:MAG: hypothetical protein IKZ34_01280 [Alphaproteobacteria bacterium]|nr:hypothetical protein [Alphaproteobacteria bacterium]